MKKMICCLIIVVIVVGCQGWRDYRREYHKSQSRYWDGLSRTQYSITPAPSPTPIPDGLFNSIITKEKAEWQTKKNFWQKQGESYWNDGDNKSHIAPLKYYRGVLLNKSGCDEILFIISGAFGLVSPIVKKDGEQEIMLPAGCYYVEIYKKEESWPYRKDVCCVDAEEGDSPVIGAGKSVKIYDFWIVAPPD